MEVESSEGSETECHHQSLFQSSGAEVETASGSSS